MVTDTRREPRQRGGDNPAARHKDPQRGKGTVDRTCKPEESGDNLAVALRRVGLHVRTFLTEREFASGVALYEPADVEMVDALEMRRRHRRDQIVAVYEAKGARTKAPVIVIAKCQVAGA